VARGHDVSGHRAVQPSLHAIETMAPDTQAVERARRLQACGQERDPVGDPIVGNPAGVIEPAAYVVDTALEIGQRTADGAIEPTAERVEPIDDRLLLTNHELGGSVISPLSVKPRNVPVP